jgi:hypothetical protein
MGAFVIAATRSRFVLEVAGGTQPRRRSDEIARLLEQVARLEHQRFVEDLEALL